MAQVEAQRFRSLKIDGVTHEYRTARGVTPTLGGVSLELGAGEFVTIVGPSGCGKSTLFNLVAGLAAPTNGSVTVNGQNIKGHNPHVAYMFQQAALLDWRDVLGNAMLGQEFLRLERRESREAALLGLRQFGLQGFENRNPWELSGGMRQRVALLRTYLTQRELLLLDEPFGALDALTRLQMQQFLLDRWENDSRTVLFITHDVEEALLLGDRVLVLGPRPTTVRATVDVAFERPREAEEILTSAEFVELKKELLAMLVEHKHSEQVPANNGDAPRHAGRDRNEAGR